MQHASRRAFLRAAVVASVTVAVPVIGGRADAAITPRPPTRLRRSMFAPHVGTSFLLVRGRRQYRAILTEVSDAAGAKGSESRFGLTYRIAGAARPADGMFRVTHPKLRGVDLYAGAVGSRDRGVYEVVVNV